MGRRRCSRRSHALRHAGDGRTGTAAAKGRGGAGCERLPQLAMPSPACNVDKAARSRWRIEARRQASVPSLAGPPGLAETLFKDPSVAGAGDTDQTDATAWGAKKQRRRRRHAGRETGSACRFGSVCRLAGGHALLPVACPHSACGDSAAAAWPHSRLRVRPAVFAATAALAATVALAAQAATGATRQAEGASWSGILQTCHPSTGSNVQFSCRHRSLTLERRPTTSRSLDKASRMESGSPVCLSALLLMVVPPQPWCCAVAGSGRRGAPRGCRQLSGAHQQALTLPSASPSSRFALRNSPRSPCAPSKTKTTQLPRSCPPRTARAATPAGWRPPCRSRRC